MEVAVLSLSKRFNSSFDNMNNQMIPNLCQQTQGPTSRNDICCVCASPLLASTEIVTHNACSNAICLECFVQWQSSTQAANRCVWCRGPLSYGTELAALRETHRIAMQVEVLITRQRAAVLYNEELEADVLHLRTAVSWADASDIVAALGPLRAGRVRRATEAAIQGPWEPHSGVPPFLISQFGSEIAYMYAQAQVRAHENQLAHWSSTQTERAASHDQDLRLIVVSFGSQPPTQTTVAYQPLPDSTLTVDQLFLQELTGISMSSIAQLRAINTSSATTRDIAGLTSAPPSTRNVADLIAFFREMHREDSNPNAR